MGQQKIVSGSVNWSYSSAIGDLHYGFVSACMEPNLSRHAKQSVVHGIVGERIGYALGGGDGWWLAPARKRMN